METRYKLGITIWSIALMIFISAAILFDGELIWVGIVVSAILLAYNIFRLVADYRDMTHNTDGHKYRTVLAHVSGLPMAKGERVTVTSFPDRLEFRVGETVCTVSRSQISDMRLLTRSQTEERLTTNTLGALAGGLLLGPVGGMAAGLKMKRIETEEYFFLISYAKAKTGKTELIVFETTFTNAKVNGMIKEFKKSPKKAASNISL